MHKAQEIQINIITIEHDIYIEYNQIAPVQKQANKDEDAIYLPLFILVVLCTPFVLAMLSNRVFNTKVSKTDACYWSLGISFIVFASGHFFLTDGMVLIVPPFIPAAKLLVYVTGVWEAFIGVALLIPRFRRVAALAAFASIVLFFSANIYAAFTHIPVGGYVHGPVWLLARTPVQAILAAWAYFFCYGEKLGP
ncbi:MAG: hypothetical protein JKX72_04235 [Robiginitomaculum sp.]|nr:hypothetical protein [Robiginitomaculum sp.]